jgi:hypothetical protein
MMDFEINRRRLLAAFGGTGVAALIGLGYATGDSVRYTMTSSHNCGDYTLNAEWRETYTRDGRTALLENTTASSEENTGTEDTVDSAPRNIHLQNVLPGDRGTIAFRLTAEKNTESADDVVTPTLGLNLTGTAENNINDAEREAGDETPSTGELQEYIDIKIWKDTGLLGFNQLGGNNLTHDLGEEMLIEDTLEEVDSRLNGEDLGEIDVTNDESVSVTLRWDFTDDGNINIVQTDSVNFTLGIGCR